MKRQLEENNTLENKNNILEDDKQKYKIYKTGDIILLDDEFNIGYDVESKKNIFTRHYANMNCPLCNEEIYEFISMGYDKDPENIEFEPTNIQNHLRKIHKDEFLTIKKSSIDITKKNCKLILIKKLIL